MFDDKKINSNLGRMQKAIWFAWWFILAIILVFLCSGAFVVVKALVYFGIL